MSDAPVRQGKLRLPLPSLMQQLGLGEYAKKSARCPFHEDRHNSFSVWQNNDAWFWKCHAGCGAGDEIDFLEKSKGISRSDATKLYLEMAGCAPSTQRLEHKSSNGQSTAFDWQECVSALKPKDLVRIGNERWYSRAFCSWLREKHLIGLFNGFVAFPVQNLGAVVGAHYRLEDGSWRYYPHGIKSAPLIIGDLTKADHVHVFESQWDAFAVCDKLRLHEEAGQAVIVTRSAGNGAIIHGLIPEKAHVIAWKQNDVENNGKRAGDEWLENVAKHAGVPVKCVETPARFKDPNEWTLAGRASSDDLFQAFVRAKPITSDHGRRSSAGDNSHNSQCLPLALLDDYPEPLALGAFHGLAGEIVRRIEPHTEADPAALLFQLLAAFGNLVGHDHYIYADGTPHYLNLYGVLVGQSSKDRKGTSWNHIANLMERVEPEWRQDRISFGLSSGEGLIWSVRDPIEETKPIREKGRYTGEYETYIANQGEADKRLFVIEAEFANVLKVMAGGEHSFTRNSLRLGQW